MVVHMLHEVLAGESFQAGDCSSCPPLGSVQVASRRLELEESWKWPRLNSAGFAYRAEPPLLRTQWTMEEDSVIVVHAYAPYTMFKIADMNFTNGTTTTTTSTTTASVEAPVNQAPTSTPAPPPPPPKIAPEPWDNDHNIEEPPQMRLVSSFRVERSTCHLAEHYQPGGVYHDLISGRHDMSTLRKEEPYRLSLNANRSTIYAGCEEWFQKDHDCTQRIVFMHGGEFYLCYSPGKLAGGLLGHAPAYNNLVGAWRTPFTVRVLGITSHCETDGCIEDERWECSFMYNGRESPKCVLRVAPDGGRTAMKNGYAAPWELIEIGPGKMAFSSKWEDDDINSETGATRDELCFLLI
jgi:hypothetical protein